MDSIILICTSFKLNRENNIISQPLLPRCDSIFYSSFVLEFLFRLKKDIPIIIKDYRTILTSQGHAQFYSTTTSFTLDISNIIIYDINLIISEEWIFPLRLQRY